MPTTTYLALPALLLVPFLLPAGQPTEAEAVAKVNLQAAAADYQIDPVHSWVLFKVGHLGIGTAWGAFSKVNGSFSLDTENAAASSVQLSLDASSINTDNKKRDDHLKGPDFFNAREFPTIRFQSTSVVGDGENFKITGELKLLGKKREVVVEMSKVGEGNDPWGNYRIGFEGEFQLDRTDFGMDFMTEGLGTEVTVKLAFEALRQ